MQRSEQGGTGEVLVLKHDMTLFDDWGGWTRKSRPKDGLYQSHPRGILVAPCEDTPLHQGRLPVHTSCFA